MTNHALLSENFVSELLNKDWVPLNEVTNTDFILSGGITIALRRPSCRLVIELVRLPEQVKIVLPYPTEDMIRMPGEAAMRRIFTIILKALQRKGLSSVDEPPPEGLTDLIGEILFVAAESQRTRRLTIFAGSELTRPAVDVLGIARSRQDVLWPALQPLLAIIPQGGLRFTTVTPGLPQVVQDYEAALIGNSFTLSGDGSPLGPIDKMKAIIAIDTRIRALGLDPAPVINALEA